MVYRTESPPPAPKTDRVAASIVGISVALLVTLAISGLFSLKLNRDAEIQEGYRRQAIFWASVRDECREGGRLWREHPNQAVGGGFTGECWDR